jgi:hypothetical protein
MRKNKIKRNQPCPCGSGKKYKKCCGSVVHESLSEPQLKLIQQKRAEIAALAIQREQQQGLGRSIISTSSNNNRIICVGNKLYSSSKWKTFHDFLSDYIKQLFGASWCNKELSKPPEDMHPFLKIYKLMCIQQKKLAQKSNKNDIFTGAMPGAASLYYWLAYNLYLIEHNKEIQNHLINRLKHPEQFAGACYETFVSAMFLKAGFSIEFEDESNRDSSHCEFIATHQNTGEKYSVEAKQRNRKSIISDRGSNNFQLDYKSLGKLLKNALKKESEHKKIIFIDVNLPSDALQKYTKEELQKLLVDFIKTKEQQFQSAPPAYIFLTNYPYHHNKDLEATSHYIFFLSDGFKMNDFGFKNTTLRQALISREKHKPIDDLFRSIKNHSFIPSTFNGSIPEFTFNESSERLRIGYRYIVPDKNGNEIIGILTNAVVDENYKRVIGAYSIEGEDRSILATSPITDAELAAYKQYPDTFFGIEVKQNQQITDPIAAYDFFYETYKNAPREIMLDFLKHSPSYSKFEKLPYSELVKVYAEQHVYALSRRGWFKEGQS